MFIARSGNSGHIWLRKNSKVAHLTPHVGETLEWNGMESTWCHLSSSVFCWQSGAQFVAAPSGSTNDAAVIDACNDHQMVLVHTNLRLFHHWTLNPGCETSSIRVWFILKPVHKG